MLKKMMLITLVTTTMLAPVALAEHGRERYRKADRVAILSEQLVDATRQMQRDVNRRFHGRLARSTDLLVTLDRLDLQAHKFRRDAIRGAHPRRLELRLDRLIVAFNRVDRDMRYVRSGRLQRDFYQVESVLRRLVRNVDVAYGARDRRHRDRDRIHGEIVLGDRGDRVRGEIVLGDRRDRVRARIRF